jgi:hypothetical protein
VSLRLFQWGVQAGLDWKAFKHLKVHADLNWGLNDVFPADLQSVPFDLYAIYLSVRFGYACYSRSFPPLTFRCLLPLLFLPFPIDYTFLK